MKKFLLILSIGFICGKCFAPPTVGGPTISAGSGTSGGSGSATNVILRASTGIVLQTNSSSDWTIASTIADGSLATNKVDSTFYQLLTNSTSGGGGSGTSVSNYMIQFTTDQWYTNNSGYDVFVAAIIDLIYVGSGTAVNHLNVDTNLDGVTDWQKLVSYDDVGLNSVTTQVELSMMVPPDAAWQFADDSSGGSSAAVNTVTPVGGQLTYFIGGSGGGGSGDVTQSGLAAGSYPTGGKVRLIHNGVSTNSFTTITAAKTAAVAGDLIWVEPGNYYENNLLKSNVNYHFMPGVKIAWTNTADYQFTIFDDRATGTTTNLITGKADIYWRSYYDTEFGYAGITLTNSNTRFIANFGNIVGDSVSTNGEQPHIIHASGSNSWVSIFADELLTGNINESGQLLGGVVWFNGEMFLNISHIGQFAGYGIWPSDPFGVSTNNLWVTSDLLECYVYADADNLNFRSWYDIKELRMGTNGTVKSGFQFLGGRHYVRIEKISSTGVFGTSAPDNITFYVTSAAEVWLDCQKLTRNGYSSTAIRVDPNCKLYANILQMEDTTTNTTSMIYNRGELWLSGTIYTGRAPLIYTDASGTVTKLSGITATSTNNTVAVFADTNVTIIGSSFVSGIATNVMVFSGAATNAAVYPVKPFIMVLATNTFNFAAPVTPATVTNWSYSIKDSFAVNLATGIITNIVPGYYLIEVVQEMSIANGVDYAKITLFKNGTQINARNASSGTLFSDSIPIDNPVTSAWVQSKNEISDRCIIFLSSGDRIEARMSSESGGFGDVFLYSGRFSITHL